MSLSKQERETDKSLALRLMLRGLGNNRINMTFFEASISPLVAIRQTTWTELLQENRVTSLFNLPRYALTGSGWLKALQDGGTTKNPIFQRDVGKLFATLKRHVKGRENDSILTLATVAQESGLNENWIFNAIESNLLESVFGKKGTGWCRGFEGSLIFVPSMFGLEL
jgi:hypothetical protein